MNYLPNNPGICNNCGKQIPYATGSAFVIRHKTYCRQCTIDYSNNLTDGLARELSIDAVNRTSYAEPYNFAK